MLSEKTSSGRGVSDHDVDEDEDDHEDQQLTVGALASGTTHHRSPSQPGSGRNTPHLNFLLPSKVHRHLSNTTKTLLTPAVTQLRRKTSPDEASHGPNTSS